MSAELVPPSPGMGDIEPNLPKRIDVPPTDEQNRARLTHQPEVGPKRSS